MDGTTTTTTGGAGEEHRAGEAPTAEQPQLLATAVGDQCANCGARLAPDQRYCVECGERRGSPRYSLPANGASASSPAASRRAHRPRMSSNASLIAGVGVLLLAMGVGVLIGRGSASTPRSSPAVITVPAAAAGPPTAATPTTTPTTASTSATPKTSTSKNPTAALKAKLPPAARTIPKKLQSSAPKLGSKCTAATRGCVNGVFRGVYFH